MCSCVCVAGCVCGGGGAFELRIFHLLCARVHGRGRPRGRDGLRDALEAESLVGVVVRLANGHRTREDHGAHHGLFSKWGKNRSRNANSPLFRSRSDPPFFFFFPFLFSPPIFSPASSVGVHKSTSDKTRRRSFPHDTQMLFI